MGTQGHIIVWVVVAGWAHAAPMPNRCVACHETEVLPVSLGHSFAEWRGSAHGRAGITCDQCHGGDPDARLPGPAHQGVHPAGDPASSVNPANLPLTCGRCHAGQLEAFNRSRHAAGLRKDGRGASCALCHGPMAASLPTPVELNARCATCHLKPVPAQAALAVMVAAKAGLGRVRRTLDEPGPAGTDSGGPVVQWRDRLHALERTYASIQALWHTFRTGEVLARSRDVEKLAQALADEVALARKPHP